MIRQSPNSVRVSPRRPPPSRPTVLLLGRPPRLKMPYGRGARQARATHTPDASEEEASPQKTRAPAAIRKAPAVGGSSSDSGGLSSLQAQELVHAVEEARSSGQGHTDLVVHGWTVRCKRRNNKPRCDIEVRDPLEGVALYSIISLKRHLGLEPGIERVVKRPKSNANASGSTPKPVWVACDACDKWREISSTGGPLPATWYCSMHPDPALASCDVPEASYQEDGMWEYDEAAMLEAAAAEAVAKVEAEAAAETAAAVAAAAASEEEAMEAMIDSAEAVAESAPADEWLQSLRDDLQIREPDSHIAAANDLLSSPQVGGILCRQPACICAPSHPQPHLI